MKRARLIKLGYLFLIFTVFAAWTIDAYGQEQKDFEKYMPLCKGTHWVKAATDTKVAFIWGVAHVILIENVLMEQVPALKVENFSEKVIEARRARIAAGGTAMTINQIVSAIDRYYQENPGKLETPVLRVIWDVGIKPMLKTGIAGRPLQ